MTSRFLVFCGSRGKTSSNARQLCLFTSRNSSIALSLWEASGDGKSNSSRLSLCSAIKDHKFFLSAYFSHLLAH